MKKTCAMVSPLLILVIAGCSPTFQNPPTNLPIPETFMNRQFLNEQASSIIQDDLSQTVDVAAWYDPQTKKITLGGPIRSPRGTIAPATVVRLENKPALYQSALTTKWSASATIPFLTAQIQDGWLKSVTIQDVARLAVDRNQTPTQAQLKAAAGPLPAGHQLFWARGALLTRINERVFKKIERGGTISGYGASIDGAFFGDANTETSNILISLFLTPVEILPLEPLQTAPVPPASPPPPRTLNDSEEPVRVIQGTPPEVTVLK